MERLKSYCNSCERITNHTVLKEEKRDSQYEQEDVQIEMVGTWQIIECNGCESRSFRETWIQSDFTHGSGSPLEKETLYPMTEENIIRVIYYRNLPTQLRGIYIETVGAFNNEMFVLCAAGLRTIIEGVCNNKKIVDGPIDFVGKGTKPIKREKNLQGRIGGLFENGFLTKQHTENLHEFRFLGNEALHTLDPPTKEELILAFDILHHTLHNIYELEGIATSLKSKRLKRKGVK